MAAQFVFTLQPVLDARCRVERSIEGELAAICRDLTDCEFELGRLMRERRICSKAATDYTRAGAGADLRLCDDRLRRLEAAAASQRRREGDLRTAYTTVYARLSAASRDRRVIERLKERRLRVFEAEANRREEMEIDEENARCRERTVRNRLGRSRSGRAAA